MINVTDNIAGAGRRTRSGATLTSREMEVLGLLVKGCSNRQIAVSLGVTFYTASTHVKNIYKKLGVRKRTEAVVEALTSRLSVRDSNFTRSVFPAAEQRPFNAVEP